MNLTAKSRYALKIMMDLALNEGEGQQQRQKIAQRQGISVDFMDHILARLREHNLIQSTRGRTGGFRLKRKPETISLWDIFSSVEESLYPVRCMDDSGCEFEENCISLDAWSEVYRDIRLSLSAKNLHDICERWKSRESMIKDRQLSVTAPSKECKGPSRQLLQKSDVK